MIELTDSMTLYHGGCEEIRLIDLGICKDGKDFGRGFYLTSSYEQARAFVRNSISRRIREGKSPVPFHGVVSCFRFHMNENLGIYCFDDPSKQWLHYVASNRESGLFKQLNESLSQFDVIGGKIANDRTATTLQLFITGAYGNPGSDQADDIAIQTLLPNRLEDQFCFKTDKAVRSLEFVRSVEC